MHREQGILLYRKNQHELDVLWIFLPPEGVSVCLSSCISSTLCPAGVVLCLAATQICIECLVHMPKAECLSPLDTWPESSVCARPDPRGTLTLKHQLTCPIKSDHMHAAACHFLTSPLVPLHICLLHKFSLLLSPLPPFLALPPWGVLLTLYMPRQLHHSRLHAQVHGHRLEGNWQYDYFYRQSLTGYYFPTTLVCYLIPLLG